MNSWHNWLEKDLKHNFGAYERPEDAVQAFLDYVIANNINVADLMEKE